MNIPHPELIWFAVVAVGLVFSVSNLVSTWRDLRADGNDPFSAALMRGLVTQVAWRTAAQLGLVISGILAVNDPGHTCAEEAHRSAYHYIEFALFAAAFSMTVNSVLGWRLRRRLNRLIEAH